MSTDGVNNSKALIKMGTPDVTFRAGGSAQIKGSARDFAQSTYHGRLHRDLILANTRVRYYKKFVSVLLLIQSLGLYYPAYRMIAIGSDTKGYFSFAFGVGIVASLILCFRVPTLLAWKRKQKSAMAALDGAPIDEYVPTKKTLLDRLISKISGVFSYRSRRMIAITQLLIFLVPALFLLYVSGGYAIIISFPMIVLGFILFSVLWPNAAYRSRITPKDPV